MLPAAAEPVRAPPHAASGSTLFEFFFGFWTVLVPVAVRTTTALDDLVVLAHWVPLAVMAGRRAPLVPAAAPPRAVGGAGRGKALKIT